LNFGQLTSIAASVNIGKWVLRNLFIGFIREEQRTRRKQSTNSHEAPIVQKVPANLHLESNGNSSRHRTSPDSAAQTQAGKLYTDSIVISSSNMIPAIAPSPTSSVVPTARSSPLLAALIPIHPISKDALPLPPIPQSPLGSNDATPMPRHTRAQTTDGGMPLSPLTASKDDYFNIRVRPSTGVGASEEPASWSGPGKQDPAVPLTPIQPGAGLMGRLKSFGGKVGAKKGSADVPPLSPVERTSFPEIKTEVSPSPYLFEDVMLIICCHRTGPRRPRKSPKRLNTFFYPDLSHHRHPAKHPTSPSLRT